MGWLLWLEEESLQHTVILDPISYFVTPVSAVICKHKPQHGDPTYHLLKIHEQCRANSFSKWNKMINKGVVSYSILKDIIEHFQPGWQNIVRLMLKFGLVIPLYDSEMDGETALFTNNKDGRKESSSQILVSKSAKEFLVPALLEENTNPDDKWTEIEFSTCFFVFTIFELDEQALSYENLSNTCFLPRGLFERLLGKAASWSQDTTSRGSIKSARLTQGENICRNLAVLWFGSRRFRLVLRQEMNAIQLDVEGKEPIQVFLRVQQQIQLVIEECMESLCCIPMLKLPVKQGCAAYVPMDRVRECTVPLSFDQIILDLVTLKQQFSGWFDDQEEPLDCYDIFLSYRWSQIDSNLVRRLFDRSSLYMIEAGERRTIQIFLDTRRLQAGTKFQETFARGLLNTTMFVPLVSIGALERLQKHDPACEDNVLAEWILALEALDQGVLKKIYPVFIGTMNADGQSQNLFKENLVERLSTECPLATLKLVRRLLVQNGLNLSSKREKMTVLEIFKEISSSLGYLAWECNDLLIPHCCHSIISVLHTCPLKVVKTISANIRTTSTNNTNSANIITTPTSNTDFESAWDILEKPQYVVDADRKRRLLDELGVESSEFLEGLNENDFLQLAECLKKAPKIIFLKKVLGKSV
eukprot:Lithocolla_globosa_v1_NODE_1626_length_2439_cov_4.208473.p1 type:complete len:642 gc:universal NODE_1626_length_2439_cov_4.208473:194-2119(+)